MKDLKELSDKYLELLEGPLKGLNLTRIISPEDFYQKQILDSVAPLDHCNVFKQKLKSSQVILDVGFGGGFPLLPLAYLNPDKLFLGFEARAKKAKAVQFIADELGIKNIKTCHQRLEDTILDKNVLITMKAVGTVDKMLACVKTVGKVAISFYKGPNFYELEDLSNVEKKWKILEEESFNVNNTEGRMLITLENKNVPHGTFKKNDKNLVKLSSLL